MYKEKYADTTLWALKTPELESLIRNATPLAQRRFALACARLAAWNTGLASAPPELVGLNDPIVQEALDAAEEVIRGGDPASDRVVRARDAADRLHEKLDDAQLTLGEAYQQATEGCDEPGKHPLHLPYHDASRRACAAYAIAYMLHDDPLEPPPRVSRTSSTASASTCRPSSPSPAIRCADIASAAGFRLTGISIFEPTDEPPPNRSRAAPAQDPSLVGRFK